MKYFYLLSLLISSGMLGYSQTSIHDETIQAAPDNNETANSDTFL